MSVTYSIKKEGIMDTVLIPGAEISGHILVKLIAGKLQLREQEILVTNTITGHRLGDLEVVKDGYLVQVEKVPRSLDSSGLLTGIVSNEHLDEMAAKGRFFMIKSSNEENIQKAREHSVWATTYSNQVRFA